MSNFSPTEPANRSNGKAQTPRPRAVILGAGFAGLWAAKHLAKTDVDVWIIDRNNYHTFFPLLYQIAAAELTPGEIAEPVRNILWDRPNVHFVMANIDQIDLINRQVRCGEQLIGYDYLVISLGSKPNFYNIPGAADFAFTLKSLEQALTLRNHILECLEQATITTDPALRQRLLTFAITGGGQTGVEFAGAFSELVRGSLAKDYQGLASQIKIYLFEAGSQLLVGQPKTLADYTLKRLEKMQVRVLLDTPVKQVTVSSIQYGDGQVLPTATVVWTAGVNGIAANNTWGLPFNRHGQIPVLPTLQVPEHPEVFVAGDLAEIKDNDRPMPMVAQAAIQEGTWAAKNILLQIRSQAPLPFHYHDKGSLSVIGRNAAVANINGVHLTGIIAWFIWFAVHIVNLVGFREKLITLINWAFDYFFGERGMRLILPYTQTLKLDSLISPGAVAREKTTLHR